jgi:hypothetical protein
MGLETRKDKLKVKPKHKPKVAIVVNKPESQDQHYRRIEEVEKRLDNNVTRRKDTLKKLGGNNKEVDFLAKSHTRRKFRLKIALAVRLETREKAFMLKRGIKVKFGEILKLKFQQEVLLEPQKTSAKLYKLKLEANVLGAVLGLESYQQEEKGVMCFGYALQKRKFKIVFLGQVTRTPGETEKEKTKFGARLKFTKQFKQGKLFAEIKLDKPGIPGLENLGVVIGFKIKKKGTFTVSISGGKNFYFSFIREL